MREIVVSTKEAAGLLGVDVSTLTLWRQKSCPGKVGRNKWDLALLVPWWRENIEVTAPEGDERLAEARRRYWSAKADSETLKVAKEKDGLCSKEEVFTAWAHRMSEVGRMLDRLSKRLPPLLEGRQVLEMMRLIEDETEKIKECYFRTGKFCEAPEEAQS